MSELLGIASKTFKEHKISDNSLEVLRKASSLEDVIIVCKKFDSDDDEDKVEFRYNGEKLSFVRLNFRDDLKKYLKRSIKCRECKNVCARNEIPFCDFLQLCKEYTFEIVKIRTAE